MIRRCSEKLNDILQERLNVSVPSRCSAHQCIKAAYDKDDPKRRCICCENYVLNYNCDKCLSCLATPHLDNFVVDDDVEEQDWYKNLSFE